MKSTGVKRVVDGPQGEVVVTGVLDDQGVPVSTTPEAQDMSSSAPTAPTPEAAPQEPDVSQIEYHDTPQIAQEDTVKKEDNGMLKLIAVGLLVLLLGLSAVFFINKRD
ncbi:hypothetical protein IJT17_02565 [bacterium]|nr:hypothetical protein [bacterium]